MGSQRKLCFEDVRQVVAAFDMPLTTRQVGQRFGVSSNCVRQIWMGASYSEQSGLPRVDKLPPRPCATELKRLTSRRLSAKERAIDPYVKSAQTAQILTPKDVLKIDEMLTEGVPSVRIAGVFGVSQSLISSIKHGTKWASVTGRSRQSKQTPCKLQREFTNGLIDHQGQDCVEWPWGRKPNSYGLKVSTSFIPGPRFILSGGEKHVRMTCGNDLCVNPNHMTPRRKREG